MLKLRILKTGQGSGSPYTLPVTLKSKNMTPLICAAVLKQVRLLFTLVLDLHSENIYTWNLGTLGWIMGLYMLG